jgi:UDP-N-acetylglucosamine enolpyruvyl transferase
VAGQIARGTGTVFQERFGAVGLLSRVPNRPEAVAEWEAAASTRLGQPVKYHADGMTGSVNQVRLAAVTLGPGLASCGQACLPIPRGNCQLGVHWH